MAPQRASQLVAVVLALSLGAAVAQAPGAAALPELPVSRVVLFTTGVGYFEHAGVVDGTREVELRVAHDQMDDLLGSLVLQDLDGGTVSTVRYAASDPLERVLGSYAIDLSRDPTLAQLLSQARGERVRVEAGETIEGIVVNVERVTTGEGATTTLVTLSSSGGLRRVALEEVRSIRFEREGLRDDLDAALAAIARTRDADANTVRLRFEGEGERRVRVGYVREMPIWKPSYRLVLGDDGRADLQGWAILDNPTSLDLVDVQVAFVAGRPISFVSELFESVYVERPRVRSAAAQAVEPRVDAGAFPPTAARSALMPSPAPEAMADSLEMAEPRLSGAGVSAMAEGVATGASFAYVVRSPVTVGRFESAMIPVLLVDVAAPRSSLFVPGLAGGSPLHAVRLVNDSGLHLAAGPVTIFDAAGFAGTALVGDLPPGEDRLLTYAVDLDVRVAVESSSESEQLSSVALRRGLVETVYRSRFRTTVRIVPGDEPRFLVVELPRRAGYEVVAPEVAPVETADALRFGVAIGGEADAVSDDAVPTHVTCATGEACRLEVVYERVDARTLALANVETERLVLFLENASLGDDDRAVLAEVVELQRRLAGLGREASGVQVRIDAIFRDQERLRQNMAALDRNTTLYRRYLAELEAQEDELLALGVEREELLAARRAAQGQLDELIEGLTEGATD